MNVVQKIFEGQGRNQLVSSGGQNDVTCCCTIQIHTFVKISGGSIAPSGCGPDEGFKAQTGGVEGAQAPR